MPELPEVEIWREHLERWLVGRRIVDADVPDRLLRGGQSRRRVESVLRGATVGAVSRRGKFLTLELRGQRPGVLMHLGMTGSFERVPSGAGLPRFTRAVVGLARGERVAFVDVRRLGQFRVVGDTERRRLEALGVEPLSRELTASKLFELTRKSRRPIKVFLMDQHRVAGLGNIHAAEALFAAGIHPERSARSLTRDELRGLTRGIRRALRSELRRSRGKTLRYLQQGGDNTFLVYGHAGEPCPSCGTPIVKIVQGGRSSYYCPSCQAKRNPR